MTAEAKPNRINDKRDQAREAMDLLFRSLNTFAEDEIHQVMAEVVLTEHRTLQAGFFRAVQAVAKEYAVHATTDLRNEAAKEYAEKVAAIDHHLPTI
jgi:hypothetical protein